MERREFLRLGSLFALGLVSSPALTVFEKIAQGLIDPQYIYKVKHRFGFWVVFSSQHPDFDNMKRTFIGSIDAAEFYSNSLELINVIEGIENSKEYLKKESSKLNSDPALKMERLGNIRVTQGVSEIQKENIEIGDSKLVLAIKNLNLKGWWDERISEDESERILIDEKECLKKGWSFAGSNMTHNKTSTKVLTIEFLLSQDDGSKKPFAPFQNEKSPNNDGEYAEAIPYENDGIEGKQINLLLCLLNQYYSVSVTRDMELANKFLKKIEKIISANEKKLSTELRLEVMNSGIKYNYMRREDPLFYNRAKELCWEQISLYPQYLEDKLTKDTYFVLPSGFKQLAIIMEKEKNFVAAISICNKAISLGLESRAKAMNYSDAGDWDKRLKRLNRKMEKSKKAA